MAKWTVRHFEFMRPTTEFDFDSAEEVVKYLRMLVPAERIDTDIIPLIQRPFEPVQFIQMFENGEVT